MHVWRRGNSMNQMSKIIKYLAIAFAFFLTVNIAFAIFYGILSLTHLFDNDTTTENLKPLEVTKLSKQLDIDVDCINIQIKAGNEFSIETNNKYITSNVTEDKLTLKEKKKLWFSKKNSELIITIPSSYVFEQVKINSEVGNITIHDLMTQDLSLDLGAGIVQIYNLTVLKKAEIDGGAGSIEIANGKIHNLDLDLGVGKTSLTASLSGNSEINAGIGEVHITLLGVSDDYQLLVNKGLGTVTIDKQEVKNDTIYGNGENKVTVDGGIGNMQIEFKKEEYEPTIKTYTKIYTLLYKTPGEESDSYYLTLKEFQGKVDTVLVKNIKENLEPSKTYEFSFERNDNKIIEDTIDSVFTNYKLISIQESNLEGLEQIQDSVN